MYFLELFYSDDWDTQAKSKAIEFIKETILPKSAQLLWDFIEPAIFGIPKKDNTLDKIAGLLKNLDNTLKTVKEAIDYQNTFKKDDDYDQNLDDLEVGYFFRLVLTRGRE